MHFSSLANYEFSLFYYRHVLGGSLKVAQAKQCGNWCSCDLGIDGKGMQRSKTAGLDDNFILWLIDEKECENKVRQNALALRNTSLDAL